MKNPTQQERGMAILQQKRGIQREEKEGDQKWEDTDSPRIQLAWMGFSQWEIWNLGWIREEGRQAEILIHYGYTR